jgi:hypothetical protein
MAIPGEHDVPTFWQRSANRFIRFPPHHDRVPAGRSLEKRKILGQMPRQLASTTDDSFRGHCDYSRQVQTHDLKIPFILVSISLVKLFAKWQREL